MPSDDQRPNVLSAGGTAHDAESDPRINRRTALSRVGVVGAASPVILALGCESLAEALGMETGSAGSASAGVSSEAHDLRHEHWHEMVGESFTIVDSPFHESAGGKGENLVLIQVFDEEIEDDPARPDHLREGAISLLFETNRHYQLPNATYVVKHPGLGRFHLFLHEIRSEDHGQVYEAVLN